MYSSSGHSDVGKFVSSPEQWIGGRSDYLKLKCINDKFVSYKHAAFLFTSHLLMDWSRVDYLWIIVMF